MRRADREVTDFLKMTEIMKSCDCCRIGLVDGAEAYIVPLNFGYEIDGEQLTLYFHCAKEGRKLDLLPKQTVVSFEMDTRHQLTEGEIACKFSWLYQCIMGTGSMEIVTDAEEKANGLQKVMAHYTGREQWEFDSRMLERVEVLKLTVKTWSCKVHWEK